VRRSTAFHGAEGGRRVVSQRAALAAGVVWAVLPVTSWYGQDARSYAMATTLACAASYLLLRVLAGVDPAAEPA
jgi:uncharacterized membrane protein